ncbi:MAG: sigma-70 family RNA polymerase sigma factor [Planctomycetes bacterium]|nr:sigma-70 family RNA polymerase sigma factor [Planctomycetota bacterium]
MSDFTDILSDTQTAIRLYIAGRGVPLSEVDDIAQDVFIDYYNHQEDRPADVEPIRWLKGMAKNHCLRYFGKRARQGTFLQELSEILDRQDSPLEDAGTDGELLNALKQCMAKLPDQQRELLQIYYGDDDRSVDRTASSVRMSVLRLRDALRTCILGRVQRNA